MAKRRVNNTLSIFRDDYEYISNFLYTVDQKATDLMQKTGIGLLFLI